MICLLKLNQRFLNGSCCNSSKLWYYLRNLNAMICKFGRTILLLAFGSKLLLPLSAAETPLPDVAKSTNAAPAILKPGPDAGKIAFVTAFMLEKLEYLQHPFDTTISTRLFDSYLSALDPQHLHFLQADVN